VPSLAHIKYSRNICWILVLVPVPTSQKQARCPGFWTLGTGRNLGVHRGQCHAEVDGVRTVVGWLCISVGCLWHLENGGHFPGMAFNLEAHPPPTLACWVWEARIGRACSVPNFPLINPCFCGSQLGPCPPLFSSLFTPRLHPTASRL
jgi:hypothetical protein